MDERYGNRIKYFRRVFQSEFDKSTSGYDVNKRSKKNYKTMLKWAEYCPDSLLSTILKIQMDSGFEHVHKSKIGLLLLLISGAACAVLISYVGELSKFFDSNTSDFVDSTPSFQPSKVYVDKYVPYKIHIHNHQLFNEDKTSLKVRKSHNDKSEVLGETLASLNLAREMKIHGKYDKALKIYQHALALSPAHPDLLNEYGEFLELTQKDVVKAEHMYCRALIISPYHTKALSNRQRTLPLVEEIDQIAFNRVDQKRDSVIKVPDSHPGLRRMKKESYFRHIHHTTAIEGNTFTLTETRSFVETRMVIAGKSIMEHNEILGMDSAYHFVNSSLVHRIGAITIQDILDIHKHVLGFVDPIGSGHFRTTQVFVGNHIPPAASEVGKLVAEFVEWLNSDDALRLHPIELGALVHYRLVFIHPFYDGNGRTSRLLMNLILMQAGYPPIIIMKEEKHLYYQHLETANAGDVRPFIRFIAICTERTLDEYMWATSEQPDTHVPSLFQSDPERVIIMEGSEDDERVMRNVYGDNDSASEHGHYQKPYL